MVPREQAAIAYRDTVRRAVDPAILEWSGPGIFSSRVFPLAANRASHIVVGYDVPLNRIGGASVSIGGLRRGRALAGDAGRPRVPGHHEPQ